MESSSNDLVAQLANVCKTVDDIIDNEKTIQPITLAIEGTCRSCGAVVIWRGAACCCFRFRRWGDVVLSRAQSGQSQSEVTEHCALKAGWVP